MGKEDKLVTDLLTGEKKPRSTLWTPGNHRYYTSEEAYIEQVVKKKEAAAAELEARKAARQARAQAKKEANEKKAREWKMTVAAREIMYNIAGIPFTDAPPGILLKKEQKIREAYGVEAFYECVVRKQDEIRRIVSQMDGQFDSVVAAGLYAFGVLRRAMPDVALQLKREARAKEELKKADTWEPIDTNIHISGAKQKSRDLTVL